MSLRLPGRMPQLDSLRTFAVLLVVIFHWFPVGEGINRLPNGTIGVIIFFVISGFLIGRILIQGRNKILSGQATLGQTYYTFFVRRALRIFPLYFLVITAVYILVPEASDIRKAPLYYYLYGYNIWLYQTDNWGDVLSIFWTLGVEEQLYLVLPWFVFLLPKRALPYGIAVMIVGGVVYRWFSFYHGDKDGVLTPASLDAFGLGVLWAYILTEKPALEQLVKKRLSLVALVALALFVVILTLPYEHLLVMLFQRFCIAVLALYLVVHASLGFKGFPGAVLNNAAMQYVGRISYGIYVFHMLVPGYIMPWLISITQRVAPVPVPGFWPYRLLSFVVLLTLATISWYLIEKPIDALKTRFTYGADSQPKGVDLGASIAHPAGGN